MNCVFTWKKVSEEYPDTDTTVLCGFADAEAITGFWDSEAGCWRSTSAMRLVEAPLFWGDLPEVPKEDLA